MPHIKIVAPCRIKLSCLYAMRTDTTRAHRVPKARRKFLRQYGRGSAAGWQSDHSGSCDGPRCFSGKKCWNYWYFCRPATGPGHLKHLPPRVPALFFKCSAGNTSHIFGRTIDDRTAVSHGAFVRAWARHELRVAAEQVRRLACLRVPSVQKNGAKNMALNVTHEIAALH